MNIRTQRASTRLICIVVAFCFIGQNLIMAAPESIRVNAGNQTFQVTPGQWISLNQGSGVTNYNVRYINGRPVALTESQYSQLVFGNPHVITTPEESLAKKVSESNPGVIPTPFASTAEGKLQKSSIRAGVTVAAKVLTGKSGNAKSQANSLSNNAGQSSPSDNAPSKVDVGLAKASSKLKSGLDPKGILLRAGISVGVELATQIVRGEKPSAKKALGVVCSAEFAGNVAGSALGAAAGAFMVPFLSGVPIIGGALAALAPTFGAMAGGSYGSYLAGDMKNGKFSLREAFNKMNWVDVTGRSVGATIGGFLGATLFPPFGIFIGGIVGGTLGAIVAKGIWGMLGGKQDAPVGSKPISVPGSEATSAGLPASGDNSITISTKDGENQTAGQMSASEVNVTDSQPSVGTQESTLKDAFSKYQELYKLYKETVAKGLLEESVKIGQEMNRAKAEFEHLKSSTSK